MTSSRSRSRIRASFCRSRATEFCDATEFARPFSEGSANGFCDVIGVTEFVRPNRAGVSPRPRGRRPTSRAGPRPTTLRLERQVARLRVGARRHGGRVSYRPKSNYSDRTCLKISFLTSEKGDLPWESPRLERCWIEASVVSLLLFWRAEDHPLSLISEGAPRRARSPATPEIFWDFGPLRRRPPMEQGDDAEDDSAIAAASDRRSRRTKRSEDRDAALGY